MTGELRLRDLRVPCHLEQSNLLLALIGYLATVYISLFLFFNLTAHAFDDTVLSRLCHCTEVSDICRACASRVQIPVATVPRVNSI